MLRRYGTDFLATARVWSKFPVKKRDGALVNMQILDLPSELFEDFMDFKMEYYVKSEATHKAAGISNSVEAMAEYKEFYSRAFKDPSHFLAIWCPEENGVVKPEIVGIQAVKLVKRDEQDYDPNQFQTKEMKKFFEILNKWNKLFPVPDVMERYGVDTYYDDRGLAIRPDYRGCGIAKTCCILRRKACKEHNVPMTGAWATTPQTTRAAISSGWKSVFKISYDELSRKLEIPFENPPPIAEYIIARPWEE